MCSSDLDWDMQRQLKNLNKPVLIFNVRNDALVSDEDANEIKQWMSGATKLIHLENTDHLLSDREAHALAISQMIEWLEK